MVADQQLNVAGIAGAQLGALPNDKVCKPLDAGVISREILPPSVVDVNVDATIYKCSDSFVHDAIPFVFSNVLKPPRPSIPNMSCHKLSSIPGSVGKG